MVPVVPPTVLDGAWLGATAGALAGGRVADDDPGAEASGTLVESAPQTATTRAR